MTARKAHKAPRWAWHIHHNTLVEPVLEEYDGSLAERRRYIKNEKPQHERALRLRLLKYVKGQLPRELIVLRFSSRAVRAAVERLHKKECPNCPWNGETIFPWVGLRP